MNFHTSLILNLKMHSIQKIYLRKAKWNDISL